MGVGVPGIYAGITDQDERKISRDVYGIYLDLEADIIKDLNVGAAVRSENIQTLVRPQTENYLLNMMYHLNLLYVVQ